MDSIRAGNIKLLLCFAFYLAWWVVGFNPHHPIRGLKSGWLLIPAAMLGIWALVDIVQGLDFTLGPVPGMAFVVGGVVSYVALVGITSGLLHRPVTSELFIIMLWACIALLEINTFVGMGSIASSPGWILTILCIVGTIASLVCYQLFYGLDASPAFIDGAIPLILAGVLTGLITWCAA
ncbi:MAG: hypothetical protein IKG21_06180 [Atopobiaceae bacterium]|nr:hypothetical protein [Atopobiaceae bacterium]